MLRPSLALLALAILSEPALACLGPAPPAPLPGESPEQAALRTKAYYQVMKDEDERKLQARLLDEAVSVQIAKVTANSKITVDGGGWRYGGHAITAQPVRALRGELSDAPLAMADRAMTDCGLRGGGPATAEQPGAWIIVFTGVRLGQDTPFNYGIPVTLARDISLLEAFNDAAAALYVESKAK